MVTDEEILAGKVDHLEEGIETVKKRINEIIEDHELSKKYATKESENQYIKGKIEAYKNSLMLIERYVT